MQVIRQERLDIGLNLALHVLTNGGGVQVAPLGYKAGQIRARKGLGILQRKGVDAVAELAVGSWTARGA